MLENFGVLNIEVYLTAVIVVIIAPGPNSLFVLATSLRHGVKSGYQAALAVFLGDYTLMFLTYLGIAALISQSPFLYFLMKIAGACFLLYLAGQIIYGMFFKKINAGSVTHEQESMHIIAQDKIFTKALVLSLTNPKALLFFFSFFPAFINTEFKPTFIPFGILTIILQIVSLSYLSLLIFAGSKFVHLVNDYPQLKWIGNLSVAVIFIGFSIMLIFGH